MTMNRARIRTVVLVLLLILVIFGTVGCKKENQYRIVRLEKGVEKEFVITAYSCTYDAPDSKGLRTVYCQMSSYDSGKKKHFLAIFTDVKYVELDQ